MISVKGLRAFWKVATLGSFRAAAEDLGVSQPVLTRQVKDLEARYGVVLLNRSGSGSRPTAAGAQLLHHADSVFGLLHQTDAFLRGYQASTLRLEAVSHVTVPRIMTALKDRFGLDVEVHIAPSRDIETHLIDAKCDLGLLTLDDDNLELERHLVGKYDMLCVVPPGHRLSGKTDIQMRDLDGEKIVIGTPMTQTRRYFERQLSKSGISVDVVFEVNCRHTLTRFSHEMDTIGVFSDTGFSRDAFVNTKVIADEAMQIPVYVATQRGHLENSLPDRAFRHLRRVIDRAQLTQ